MCTRSLRPCHACLVAVQVEIMYSYEVAGDIIGDPAFYERAEQVAYNALPATLTKDMWAHQYLQQANEVGGSACRSQRSGCHCPLRSMRLVAPHRRHTCRLMRCTPTLTCG